MDITDSSGSKYQNRLKSARHEIKMVLDRVVPGAYHIGQAADSAGEYFSVRFPPGVTPPRIDPAVNGFRVRIGVPLSPYECHEFGIRELEVA